MSIVNSGPDGLKQERRVVPATDRRTAARDRDRARAKLEAHQAYLAGLNPDSIKAEDARQQIRALEEDLWIKTKWAEGR